MDIVTCNLIAVRSLDEQLFGLQHYEKIVRAIVELENRMASCISIPVICYAVTGTGRAALKVG
jgi:hypothetical protein